MLWKKDKMYRVEPFELEAHLEESILEVASELFGDARIYLDIKKKIGGKGKKGNIPDAYLIDLSSTREPKLFVVENELARHEPLKHIAVQILEFSLSFEDSPQKVKGIIKKGLQASPIAMKKCVSYAERHGFENIDYLLERMVYGEDAFNAMVIIDELEPELEAVLINKFQFPVEILEFKRFVSVEGDRLYEFEPFLADVTGASEAEVQGAPLIDFAEVDTIVVPAKDGGFQDVFLGENRWHSIRIRSSMLPRIKHIAVYRVAPTSAITHIAEVKEIEQWKDTNKYVVVFTGPAKKINPIKLVPKSRVKAPQAPRYTSIDRLEKAKNLNEAF